MTGRPRRSSALARSSVPSNAWVRKPAPARLELELEVQDAAGGGQVEGAPDLLRVGGGPPVAEDHGERRGAALVGVLGDEGHGGDEVALARGDVGAHGVQRDPRTSASEEARQEEQRGARALRKVEAGGTSRLL